MTAPSLSKKFDRLVNAPYSGLLLALTVLTLLFLPVFYTNYAFLDEAYQLWHNKDDSNFTMDLVQGRWLTGLIFLKSFSSTSSISGLKIMRIISFFSWALFLEEFFRLGGKWRKLIAFDKLLLTMGGLYIACSLSLAVYIGWGVCLQIGIACLLSLWSGHLYFISIMGNKGKAPVIVLRFLLIVILAIVSLFMYQVSFGAFLLPFALYMVANRSAASLRVIVLGIGAYLLMTLLYYLLFRCSLSWYSVSPGPRATLSFDLLGKLGFFFSAPLSQAFSLNFLYNMHSIPSQAFPILVIAAWLTIFFKKDTGRPREKIRFVPLFIALCMFIYLPVLVAKEDFASYRTMFVLNLVVTFLLIDIFLSLIRQAKFRNFFIIALLCCFIGVGFRNFRYNFIDPLRDEYRLLSQVVNDRYVPSVRTIYFLRPAEDLFRPAYGINAFKDEFGVPSTFKDWTPESLMKQLIFERTKDRAAADGTRVIQFTDREAFTAEENRRQPDALYVDMEAIFHRQ
jgi:hypothetical protein